MTPQEIVGWPKAFYERIRVQRLSRARLEAEQDRKFRQLVALAYERSPFYRSIIEERALDLDRCRPADFPVLTKELLADNFDRILTDPRLSRRRIEEFLSHSDDPGELLDGKFHVLHSSGTSGTVATIVYSHDAWIKGASQMARVFPLGLRTRVAFVAATLGHFAGASLLVTGNYGTNRLFFNIRTYDVGGPLDQIVDGLNDFQPRLLTGYAAVLDRLAEFQDAGILRIHPRLVVSGAEPLWPHRRTALERAFHAPLVNAYASTEQLFMALTLPGSDGMHLLEDDLIFELRDDCTYVTNLFNHTLPLIRYRMDDVLIPANDSSGRYPFRKIRDLVGRSENRATFVNEDGAEDSIHPSVFAELFVPGLKSWQVQVVNPAALVLRARFERDRSREQKEDIRRKLCQRLQALLAQKRMANVGFEVEEVERLEVDPRSGKTPMVLAGASAPGVRGQAESTLLRTGVHSR